MELQQSQEKAELESVFGDMLEFVEDTPALLQANEEPEIFYLWDTKLKIFNIFKILRNYMLDNDRFDSALTLRLIDHNHLDLEDALLDLAYIKQGFLSKLPKGN